MAQVALLTKGIVYDTSRQVVTLHQMVERFMLGDSLCEKCIVTEIMFDEHAGYTYTLIGLKSLRSFSTRFIFDEHESASGFFADLAYPTFLAAEQVAEVGVAIIRQALEAPMRAIAQNAGFEGSVVVERVKGMATGEGLNCANGEYGNMIEMGVNDPVKVTRTALQSAASVAALILITEATINEIPKEGPDLSALAAGMQGGGGMY